MPPASAEKGSSRVYRVASDQKPQIGFVLNSLFVGHFSSTSSPYHRVVHEAVSGYKTLKSKIGQNFRFWRSWHFDHLKPNDIFMYHQVQIQNNSTFMAGGEYQYKNKLFPQSAI
jgi:hypothetical protein